MSRPVRIFVEECVTPTADGDSSRTLELRVAVDAAAVGRAAGRVIPATVVRPARRPRLTALLSSGVSSLRAHADRVAPALAPKASVIKESVVSGAGLVRDRIASEVTDAQAADRAADVTRRLVERFSGKLHGPTCPACGRETFLRVSEDTGQVFAACTGHETAGCNFVEFIELGR